MHGIKIQSYENPGPLRLSGKMDLLGKFGLYIGIGLIIVVATLAYLLDMKTLFWKNYLVTAFFFIGFSIFGYLFVAIHHASNATWSASIRRVAEGLTNFLIPAFVVFLILGFFGKDYVFDWTNENVTKSFSDSKKWYLSETAYYIKLIIFFAFLYLLGNKIIGFSLKQDETGDNSLSLKARKYSIAFLLPFAYLFTIFVVDNMLSIDSRWYSTMFGVYCFSGFFLSGYVVLALLTVKSQENGFLTDAVKKHNLKDVGTWIMGFSCFFAYIGFSQYMLVWYANLPAETFYFMERSQNGWEYLFVIIPILKWIIPFVFLMPWNYRSNPKAFKVVGSIVLIGQYIDIYWMVMPSGEFFSFTIWMEILLFIGFLAIFLHSIFNFYTKHSLVAYRDPKILTSINGEYL